MTAHQLQHIQGQFTGQGVSNILQTIIAAGILWMASSVGDMKTVVELHEYRITQIEQTQELKK